LTVWHLAGLEDGLDVEQAVPEILRSLRLIESPPSNLHVDPPQANGQVSRDTLPRIFDGVDELIPKLILEEYLTPRQATAIRAVHRALDDLATEGDDDLWTSQALKSREEWQPVRRAARRALDEMNALIPNRRRIVCPD
jgi:hypothetical protein